ncbi:TRAP transporter, 4TM/12TM fusion protein [uncultured Alphaproteobacteria bacterium]|uniref:TRAP transporter, 4TM/12TM fusion protein n=1 Tax=uncultured Alphaproteobacteria bacterium TaxID=91750 RepID=A0A212KM90_9PROT|nr:TRAP transporter, 4TM/12TM fusion protein [uncultured Alphaproteobacteria bacterium]
MSADDTPSSLSALADAQEPAHNAMPDRATPVGKAMFAIALAFAVWQVYIAAYAPLSSVVLRAIHVGFLLLMVFGLSSAKAGRPLAVKGADWIFGLAAFATGLYQWVFEGDLILRAGDPSTADIVVGSIAIVLVFEGSRRIMGLALPSICLAFVLFALYGEYLPSPFNHRGFDFDQVVDQFAMGMEGIYGTPTYVSATYIFLFIVFSSFLERAGIIRLFADVAIGVFGHTRGGPAKVAVVSSALMGTVNGSGVANVVTTGPVTIPIMKKIGFKSAFSGAVVATASMGGQIMPPVMGAVAFIMAETLGVSYAEIVQAAVVPAILYFGAAFWMVHLEACRLGLKGLPYEDLPDWKTALRKGWYLLMPLGVLIYLLFQGFTPLFSGTMALAITAALLMGLPLAARLGPFAFRVAFWVVLGAAGGLFFEWGVDVIFAVLAVLALALLAVREGKKTLQVVIDALVEGARNAVPVGMACALVGVIVGTMTLTGAATNFARAIVAVGEHSLFLSLVLTMITCLILGMGVPTIPNYIITSSLVGPALLDLGVPLIVSHMFVFYFGIMADLTPPVALAAFAAAPIARAGGLEIGIQCMRVAIAGFVVPYMAVYAPVMMLQDGGPLASAIGYWPAVAYTLVKAAMSVGMWGIASVGFWLTYLTWWERLWAAAAAFCLVAALPLTDQAGFAMAAAFFLYTWTKRRRSIAAGQPG